MNILLINHYAGSDRLGMEYRPFYLAREWAESGHQVTIIAADQSHLRSTQPEVRQDLTLSTEEGVRFRWLRTPRYAGNGVARVLNMLTFVLKLGHYARRIAREDKPDIVICSSTYPLDIYPGELIARHSNALLVYEVHDLWPLTPMLLGGYKRWHPYIQLLQHAEDRACARADVVVSILPDARGYMVKRGMANAKFVHVPNGAPAARMSRGACLDPPPLLAPILELERERGRFLVGYAGSLTLSMDVDLLLDVAIQRSTSDVSFFIAGDGPMFANLRARLRSLGIDSVHLLGRIPKTDVPGFLAAMDALAVPWHANPLYQYGVSPNKIFDYMLAARPILQASDASNDLVTEAGCGFTVPPGDPQAFADAIGRLRALPAVERAKLGANGRRFVCEHHDFRDLAKRFLVATDQIARNRSASPQDRTPRDAVATL
jgi:glycosyltransferase involved in cell wall biosynthesis